LHFFSVFQVLRIFYDLHLLRWGLVFTEFAFFSARSLQTQAIPEKATNHVTIESNPKDLSGLCGAGGWGWVDYLLVVAEREFREQPVRDVCAGEGHAHNSNNHNTNCQQTECKTSIRMGGGWEWKGGREPPEREEREMMMNDE